MGVIWESKSAQEAVASCFASPSGTGIHGGELEGAPGDAEGSD